jgi:hypothetical protein
MKVEQSILDWLLEDENPSVKYRTLTELLDTKSDDPSVQNAKARIRTSNSVQSILAKMHPDGYWLHREKGDTIQYGMSASTHFVLAYLAELGLDREDKQIALAAGRYLELNPPDYHLHMSCLYAYNLRTFVMLGYKDDPRVQERINVLLNDKRYDGGYLCDQKTRNEKTRGCIRGSIKALMAFAAIPELWKEPRCRQVVDYFLKRRIFFRTDLPNEIIRDELVRVGFPFVIAGSLLEPLYALSVMGIGQNERLQEAWRQLEIKKDMSGKYISDGYTNTLFRPDKKGQPSKWVSLYALLALKHDHDPFRPVQSES